GPVMPVIADEMKKLTDGPKDSELARARTQLKAGLLMSLESTSSRAEQIGRQMLIFGRVIPMEELVAHVDAVDFDAVRRVAENVLEGPMALASVGEGTTMPNEDKAQKMFK
ncbi:MAG: insulinase family protein, partial [Sphingomonadales bacterium]|nr:insulinase family protein [Sphingomonadales bacterium]